MAFDCNVVEKDMHADYEPTHEELNQKPELQMDNLDIMDFITNMDFKPSDHSINNPNAEVPKTNIEDPFNFDGFTASLDKASPDEAKP